MTPEDSQLEALRHYAEGTATRKEVAVLERTILEDAAFRQFAIEYLHLDSALEEFGTVQEARPVPRVAWALAAAAAIVLGCALWAWSWPRHANLAAASASPAVEVEFLQLRTAEIAEPPGGVRQGDHVRLRSLGLRSGEAQLRLSSGVELVFAGPGELQFLGAMHARVVRGKVTVDCGERGQGFILDTPVTRVVDVSTKFGVEARGDGLTDVLVLEGSVDLVGPQGPQHATPLEQGEAVRVDASQALARIVNITGGGQPGDWSTRQPPGDCNLTSVSDNFGAAVGFHFYRTVPHGLRAGALVYTNRPYVWRAWKGQDFPASVLDADVVQTFFGELGRRDYEIEIEVARPVELFILVPGRGHPQPWLTEHFTRTGEELSLDETGSNERSLSFEVWKRTIPQAGLVTLGPTNRDDSGRPTGMYGIAAKALSP